MATTIEVDRAGVYEAIDYRDFSIEIPTSAITVAPSATLVTRARESIEANQDLRITIDGTVAFEGVTNSPGTVRETGAVELEVDHPAAALFSESVDIALTSPTTVDVLNAALTNATRGGDFTLDYSGTAVSLASDYRVEGRPVGQVFRDIMDRTSRVWWIDPAGTTIHVEPVGARGTWQALDAQTDGVSVRSFDEGSVSTVRNDVTVTATEGEAVSATATDSTSINTYGRRSESINIGYAATATEAQSYADELLIPEPLSQAELVVPQSVGNVVQPLANYQIDLTDSTKDISATGLVVEKQTLRQGRITIKVGEGSGVSVENVSRNSKSRGDETEPGTVYGNDRIGDDAVDTPQLVNTAVIESKLADAAVATQKLQNNAVINGKLDNLSVSETKIQDDSISTPKLVAAAVTASEIAADTITAAEIAAGTITALEIDADTITASEIAAGTITALEIAANEITANEIDVLNLDANEIEIGVDGGNAITFDTGGTFSSTRIVPAGDGLNTYGTSTNYFEFGFTESAIAQSLTIEDNNKSNDIEIRNGDDATRPTIRPATDNDGSVGTLSNRWDFMVAGEFTGDQVTTDNIEIRRDTTDPIITALSTTGSALRPDNDNSCALGTDVAAFSSINAHNFVTATPEPLSGVDLSNLPGYSWENPPEYATRRKAPAKSDRDYERASPTKGLSLDHMTNYLLETCKAQQEHIADLTTRLNDLEARLEALEDPNA